MSKLIDKLTEARMSEIEQAVMRQKLAQEMTHKVPQSAGEALVEAQNGLNILPPWYQTLGGERAGQGFTEALQAISQNRGEMQIGDTSINPIDFVNPVAGIFGGKMAKTADLMALREAMNRATAGDDVQKIWQDTGWFKSPDGQWRFEIDDSAAVANFEQPYNGRLGDRINHPDLYAAYPDTARLNLTYEPQGNGGAFTGDHITVRGKDAKSAALHELQHSVQDYEGFATGGSADAMTAELLAPQRAIKAKMAALDAEMGKLTFKPNPTIEELRAHSKMSAEYAELAKQLKAMPSPLDVMMEGGRQYARLAGEAEARAVQSRMNLTPEQRRMRFPLEDYDVPVDELIMRFGN